MALKPIQSVPVGGWSGRRSEPGGAAYPSDVPPADSLDLPRRQSGNSPQGLTVTLLADYGLRAPAWFPSGAIVALLGESGVSPGSARAGISRLARRGVIESKRRGRSTAYRLTARAAAGLVSGGAAVASFTEQAETWDGYWTLVAFSLPQEGDARRRALRSRLRWIGCAPLYDGLWVSPTPLPDGASEDLVGEGLGSVTIFRARCLEILGPGGRDPLGAWDLDPVRERYELFVKEWGALRPRIRAGDLRGAEALRTRTVVMDTYRHFLSLDPRVPVRLMPRGWPRQRAREVFAEVYDGLLDVALEHVVEAVRTFDADERPYPAAHTVEDLRSGVLKGQAGTPAKASTRSAL